jgi:predicted nucleic acid-binding protein
MSVSPLITPRVVPRDVDDDHVIAAALGAGADLVVSGDADSPASVPVRASSSSRLPRPSSA